MQTPDYTDINVSVRVRREGEWPEDYPTQLCRDIESSLRVSMTRLRVKADVQAEVDTPVPGRCQCCDCQPVAPGQRCGECGGAPCAGCQQWVHLCPLDCDHQHCIDRWDERWNCEEYCSRRCEQKHELRERVKVAEAAAAVDSSALDLPI